MFIKIWITNSIKTEIKNLHITIHVSRFFWHTPTYIFPNHTANVILTMEKHMIHLNAQSLGVKISKLRRVRLTTMGCPEYNVKLHLMVRLQF